MAAIVDWFLRAQDAREALGDVNDTSLSTQAGRVACDLIASRPDLIATPTLNLANGNPAAVAAAIGQASYVCGEHWQNQNTDAPVAGDIPFSGGQCPGTVYQATVLFRDANFNNGQTDRTSNQTGLIGPIEGVELRGTDPSNPSRGRSIWVLFNGTERRAVNFTGNGFPYSNPRLSNVQATSGPDDCGDPAPGLPTPGPNNPGLSPGTPVTLPVGGNPVDFIPRVPDEPRTGSPFPFVEVTDLVDVAVDLLGQDQSSTGPLTPGEPQDIDGTSGELDAPDGADVAGYAWRLKTGNQSLGAIQGSNPAIYPFVAGNLQLRVESTGSDRVYDASLTIRAEQGSVYVSEPSTRVEGVQFNILDTLPGIVLTPLLRSQQNDG